MKKLGNATSDEPPKTNSTMPTDQQPKNVSGLVEDMKKKGILPENVLTEGTQERLTQMLPCRR